MAITIDNLTPEGRKFFKELEELAKLEVQVGFHEDAGAYDDGMPVAAIAVLNEFGASQIPARPFMKQSFEAHEKELLKACEQVNKELANGGTAESALKKLGVYAKGVVQDEIVNGGFAPNAPSTIAKKRSEQPLIDSGQMRQSVNYKIEKA